MTKAPAVHKIGSIPDVTMWEGHLAFRLDISDVEASLLGPETTGKLRRALDLARSAVQCAEADPVDGYERHRDDRATQLAERVEQLAQAIAEAKATGDAAEPGLAAALEAAGAGARRASSAAGTMRRLIASRVASEKKARYRADPWRLAHQDLEPVARSLSAAEASSQRRIAVAVDPCPVGRIGFDAESGEFTYDRDGQDRTPFQVQFTARVKDRYINQAVTVSPLPALPEAADKIVDRLDARNLFEDQRETRYTDASAGMHVRTGLDLSVEPELLEAGFKDVVICGHIVRVSGHLKSRLGAATVSICARYVVFADESSIDVSGKNGAPLDKPEADVVTEPGADGNPGVTGHPGQDGGTISIVAEQIIGTPRLIANGGVGGPGQNGGRGAKGKQGDPGRDDDLTETTSRAGLHHHVRTRGTPGHEGKKGGDGGRAGQQGKHGKGGTIRLWSVAPCLRGRLEADPGQRCVTAANATASAGEGGEGGEGGVGGERFLYDYPFGTKYGRYAQGPRGPAGAKGQAALEAEPGDPGDVSPRAIGYATLCAALTAQRVDESCHGHPDSALVSMVLFAAERLYLNAASAADIAAVQDALAYLLRLTATPEAGVLPSKIHAINRRCSLLQTNLGGGLDYFGKTPDFVPSISLAENDRFYLKFRDAAKALEADYREVTREDAEAKEWQDKLEKQIARATDLIEGDLQPKASTLDAHARELYRSIEALTDRAITQEAEVQKRTAQFQASYLEWKSRQELFGYLRMAWSIVMVGVNGTSLFTSGLAWLSDAAKAGSVGHRDAAESGSDKHEKEGAADTAPIVEAFGKVTGALSSIYDDYQKCVRSEDWKDDSVKLVLEHADGEAFDAQIDRFMEVPGAAELKDAVHEYLDLVTTRNKQIVEHDSALRQARSIRGQIEVARQEAAEVRGELETHADPGRPVFVQYMRSSMQLVKAYIVETLYMMFRSTEYYTLARAPLDLADASVSLLERQYSDLQKRLQRAEEDLGAHFDNKCWLTIEAPAQLDALKNGRPVWVSVPLNTNRPPTGPFAYKDRPMVHRIECYLEGLASREPRASATIAIEHAGVSCLYNERTGETWSFAHKPRTIAFQYEVAGSGPGRRGHAVDVTEGGKFMMLSPFAVWGVQLRKGDGENWKLDASTVQRVELVFTVKCGETAIDREMRPRSR